MTNTEIHNMLMSLHNENINILDYINKDDIAAYVANPYNFNIENILFAALEFARSTSAAQYPYGNNTLDLLRKLADIIDKKLNINK